MLAFAALAPAAQAIISAGRAPLPPARSGVSRVRVRILIATLHMIQPLARLWGRLQYGLSPWRIRGRGLALPFPTMWDSWSESWHSLDERARTMADSLQRENAAWVRGGDFDRWDFEVRGGLFASARLLSTVEEHAGGRQMARIRAWPRVSLLAFAAVGGFGALAAVAATTGAWPAAVVLGVVATIAVCRLVWELGRAMGVVATAVSLYGEAAK
jgi:hypothetical protein